MTLCDQSFQMNILEHYRCSNRQFPHRSATSCWVPASRLIRLWNIWNMSGWKNAKQCLRVLQQWLDFGLATWKNQPVIRRSFPQHPGRCAIQDDAQKRSSAQKKLKGSVDAPLSVGAHEKQAGLKRKRLLENLLHSIVKCRIWGGSLVFMIFYYCIWDAAGIQIESFEEPVVFANWKNGQRKTRSDFPEKVVGSGMFVMYIQKNQKMVGSFKLWS